MLLYVMMVLLLVAAANLFLSMSRKTKGEEEMPQEEKFSIVVSGLTRRVLDREAIDRDPTVELIDPADGSRKVIVNREGRFENYPGAESYYWVEQKWIIDQGAVRFRTEFIDHGDGYRCLWQVDVKSDGRDYMDEDGFGMERDTDDVILYADMNAGGEFLGPFRLYSVNGKLMRHVS